MSFFHGRSSAGIVHKDLVRDLRIMAFSMSFSETLSCWTSGIV
jgi:hypothetical protein